MTTMVPRVWRAHKNKAALVIQRYMKGYYAFYKKYDEFREKKLQINFAFFAAMKEKHHSEA